MELEEERRVTREGHWEEMAARRSSRVALRGRDTCWFQLANANGDGERARDEGVNY